MKLKLFLTLTVLLSTLSASAYDFMKNGIAYMIVNKNSVKVVEGGVYEVSITIP